MFIKATLKDSVKVKMQSVSLFLDIIKVADFHWNNADVSKTEGLRDLIYLFFGSLDKAKAT